MEIGGALKRWRAARGLSLRGLGARAGADYTTIHRIENGRLSPTVNMLGRLAKALGTTVPALFAAPPESKGKQKREAGNRTRKSALAPGSRRGKSS